MRAYGKKIVLEMILEERGSSLIQTLDGSDRPQSLVGKVVAIGSDAVDINVGDLVLAQVGVGSCYKDGDGKSYKSMDYTLADGVFDASEIERVKLFKRV